MGMYAIERGSSSVGDQVLIEDKEYKQLSITWCFIWVNESCAREIKLGGSIFVTM